MSFFSLLLLIGIAGLSGLALTIVSSVLIASRHSLVIWQQTKAALGILVWVVPAAAVVGLIGTQSRWTSPDAPARPVQVTFLETRGAAKPGTLTPAMEVPAERTQPVTASLTPISLVERLNGASPRSESPPRLRVRSTSSDDPKWTETPTFISGRELISLSSGRFATIAEAEEQVASQALARARQHFSGMDTIDWHADQVRVAELIDQNAVKDCVGEVIPNYDFGNGIKATMYRVHARIDLNAQLADALQNFARDKTVDRRLMSLGGLLGLVTLMLGTAASYFRLDDATNGAYRKRLKLAAVALIAAASLAATRVIA